MAQSKQQGWEREKEVWLLTTHQSKTVKKPRWFTVWYTKTTDHKTRDLHPPVATNNEKTLNDWN